MIQMMTAYTTEIDEIEDGINEILGQIDFGKLKTNSAGLVTCHYDFAQTDFIEKLREKLPFDIIGMTTLASANNHGFDMYALTLTVLTSDDIIFKTALSKPINNENFTENIDALYKGITKDTEGDPSLIIAFFPYLKDLSGAHLLNALDKACGGIPVWGSLATNIDVDYERCHAFRNEIAGQSSMAILLMYGEIDPDFIIISIPEQNITNAHGVITESDGCILKKINGLPALEYLESIGVTFIEKATAITPLMVYYDNNTEPVALAIYSILDDGGFLCGGEMTEGAALAVGEISSQGILATARDALDKLQAAGKKDGALILPCMTRYIMLTSNQNAELELIYNSMQNKMPFIMGYSGGEVCPVRDSSGRLYNRFHNFTFSACVF